MAHNKTLAAQLATSSGVLSEQRGRVLRLVLRLLPARGVYPAHDTYIEKDTPVNEDIERLRHSAMTPADQTRRPRRGLGLLHLRARAPQEYGQNSSSQGRRGLQARRDPAAADRHVLRAQRLRPRRGQFRVRGDTLEVHPSAQEIAYPRRALRRRARAHHRSRPVDGRDPGRSTSIDIYPARYFVTSRMKLEAALHDITAELEEQVKLFEEQESCSRRSGCGSAPSTTWRCCRRLGFCLGGRELLADLHGREPGSHRGR